VGHCREHDLLVGVPARSSVDIEARTTGPRRDPDLALLRHELHRQVQLFVGLQAHGAEGGFETELRQPHLMTLPGCDGNLERCVAPESPVHGDTGAGRDTAQPEVTIGGPERHHAQRHGPVGFDEEGLPPGLAPRETELERARAGPQRHGERGRAHLFAVDEEDGARRLGVQRHVGPRRLELDLEETLDATAFHLQIIRPGKVPLRDDADRVAALGDFHGAERRLAHLLAVDEHLGAGDLAGGDAEQARQALQRQPEGLIADVAHLDRVLEGPIALLLGDDGIAPGAQQEAITQIEAKQATAHGDLIRLGPHLDVHRARSEQEPGDQGESKKKAETRTGIGLKRRIPGAPTWAAPG
jgi:hypothetical protein